MKRRLLALKARISSNDGNTSERKQDWQSPVLDNARTVCQLLSNLGSGAINVPGLQAAGQVGMQIIDIIKVSRLKLVIVALVIKISIRRKQKVTRPITMTSWYASSSSWIQYGRHSKIRAPRASISVSKKILNVSRSMSCIFYYQFLLLTMAKGLEKDSGYLTATSRSKRGRASLQFRR